MTRAHAGACAGRRAVTQHLPGDPGLNLGGGILDLAEDAHQGVALKRFGLFGSP